MRAKGEANFSLAVFPAFSATPAASAALRAEGVDGIFTRHAASLPTRTVAAQVERVREAGIAPPVKLFNAVTWRRFEIALVPSDSAFEQAAVWRVRLAPNEFRGVSNLLPELSYAGDIARRYSGKELLDDEFYRGAPWRIGLKRFRSQLTAGPLELRVLPLRSDAPVYIEKPYWPSFSASAQAVELRSYRVIPEYELVVGGVRR